MASEPPAAAFLESPRAEQLAPGVPEPWVSGLVQLHPIEIPLGCTISKTKCLKKPCLLGMIPSSPGKHLGLLQHECQTHTTRSLSARSVALPLVCSLLRLPGSLPVSFPLHAEQMLLAPWDKSSFCGSLGLELYLKLFSRVDPIVEASPQASCLLAGRSCCGVAEITTTANAQLGPAVARPRVG